MRRTGLPLRHCASAIALAGACCLNGCEWIYPSVSVSPDGGAGDFTSSSGSGSTDSGFGTSSGGDAQSSSGGSGDGATTGGSGSGSGSSGSGGGNGDGGGSSSGSDSGGVASAPIAFVQSASQDTKNGTAASIDATYPNPQHAGDLNVVVVGWGSASNTVDAVSDSAGNTYVLARQGSNTGSAIAIYYARAIAGGSSNTVTVSLGAEDVPCVAVLEYSGLSALDQTAVGTGSSDTASTSTVVTTEAAELVLGAGEPDQKQTADFTSAGSGFTQRALTQTSGLLAEDKIVSQTGSYAATGVLSDSFPWVMAVATFK